MFKAAAILALLFCACGDDKARVPEPDATSVPPDAVPDARPDAAIFPRCIAIGCGIQDVTDQSCFVTGAVCDCHGAPCLGP